ncbi:MAG: S1 RNA-binding domain-containing protein [Rhodocyclaceae bacterium]|nr:S1 RNA-binding domain-containing protein [Rhodocyclaceae bacterium]
MINDLREGQIVYGVVKRIKRYGAFIDLGGLDGLLHITNLSYKRLKHPSEVVKVGDVVRVQILQIDHEMQRLWLGMKQLESDPWESASSRYPIGGKVRGVITGVTKYGAFVELETGIEGLAHVADMNWSKHFADPSEIVSNFQEVAVIVLQVDSDKRRIKLALCSDG